MELSEIGPQTGEELAFKPDNADPDLRLIPGDLAVGDAVVVTFVEEQEVSQIDLFKMNFHHSVVSIESEGISAISYISGVIEELKGRRAQLGNEASLIESQALISGYDHQSISQLAQIDEERVLIYHQLKWAAGYDLDRSSVGKLYKDFFDRH